MSLRNRTNRVATAILSTITFGALAASPRAAAESNAKQSQSAPIVFFDIAGQDTDKMRAFYSEVFGWQIGAEKNGASPFNISAASPLPGVLRKEAATKVPPNETLIYLGVTDITATLAQVVAQGGGIVYPRIEVPGVVVMALFKDPAGNRIGLVEMENGKAKVPKTK